MSPPLIDLQAIPGPIILAGEEHIAYRDPLLHYHDGIFRLFCSVVETRPDGDDRFHVGVTESRDLRSWGRLRPVTVPDDPRSFCGPGAIVRHDGRAVHEQLPTAQHPRRALLDHGQRRPAELAGAAHPAAQGSGSPGAGHLLRCAPKGAVREYRLR